MNRVERAATAWGALSAPPRLIAERENAVYEVRFADGRRAALRLHRPGYQSDATIASELRWTEALAAEGFPCPAPLRTLDGALTHHFGADGIASLVSWLDGQSAAEIAPTPAHFRALGALIARLHDVTDATVPAGIVRPNWDTDAFLGEAPLWGRFWENPALTVPEREMLLRARRDAAARLDALGPTDTGLIHADLLPDNVLVTERGLAMLDFDDSGYGYRSYDLGTALIRYWGVDAYGDLRSALLDGYGARRTVSEDEADLFVLLRSFASAGWIVPRAAPDDPRVAFYARRAVAVAKAFLASS